LHAPGIIGMITFLKVQRQPCSFWDIEYLGTKMSARFDQHTAKNNWIFI